MSYNGKVYRKQGGNEIVVASGGKITVEAGGVIEKDLNLRIPLLSGKTATGAPLLVAAAVATDFIPSASATNAFNLAGTVSNGNAKTNDVLFDIALPNDYVAGTDITAYIAAGYATSGGTVSLATVDLVAGLATDAGAGGADICATAAQTIAADTAEKAFTITGTTLTPGCRLVLKATVAITNNNATNTTGYIYALRLA